VPKKSPRAPAPPSSVLTPDEPLLTTEAVAEWFGVSPRTVDDWVLDGRLNPVKVGRLNRFPLSRVQAFIVDKEAS
jgi:excisionase family DNA binding protein